MKGLDVSSSDRLEVKRGLTELTDKLLPVIAVNTVLVMALLLEVEPRPETVNMDPPYGAYALTRRDHWVFGALFIIEAYPTLLIVVKIFHLQLS